MGKYNTQKVEEHLRKNVRVLCSDVLVYWCVGLLVCGAMSPGGQSDSFEMKNSPRPTK